MSAPSCLHFVEEINEHHYTFRYGLTVFALIQHQQQWCLLHKGETIFLDSDTLHDALYNAIERFQRE